MYACAWLSFKYTLDGWDIGLILPASIITWDTQKAEDNQQLGSHEPAVEEEVVGNRRAVHMRAGVLLLDTQQKAEMADQCVTSAAKGVWPWVVVRTCHLACPFQPCVGSAILHKNIS